MKRNASNLIFSALFLIAFLVIFLLVTGCASTSTTVAPQPPVGTQSCSMFRCDASHSGNYTLVAGTTGTTVSQLWSYTTGDPITSSPAVVNGVVYLGSDNIPGKVYALNAATGVQLWNYTTGMRVESSPAVANGVVYVGSDDNKVYALNTLNQNANQDMKTVYVVFFVIVLLVCCYFAYLIAKKHKKIP